MSNVQQDYFCWLYAYTGLSGVKNPRWSHWLLAEQLHCTEYTYFVANDDNRAADGISLREEYCEANDISNRGWVYASPPTVFEVLIGLAKRSSFLADDLQIAQGVDGWLVLFLTNLGLFEYTDAAYYEDTDAGRVVYGMIEDWLSRRYDYAGNGGLFPLVNPPNDQATTELIYQLNYYIQENAVFED